jgi:hypothetical protein
MYLRGTPGAGHSKIISTKGNLRVSLVFATLQN